MLLRLLSLFAILFYIISAQEYDPFYSDQQQGPIPWESRKLKLVPAPSQKLASKEYPRALQVADVIRKRRSTDYLGKQTLYGPKPQPGRKHRQKYGCKSWKQQTIFVCWGKKRMGKN